jgi:hypothetical protein
MFLAMTCRLAAGDKRWGTVEQSQLQRNCPPTRSHVVDAVTKASVQSASLMRILFKRTPWPQFLVRLKEASENMPTSCSFPSDSAAYNFSAMDNLARRIAIA